MWYNNFNELVLNKEYVSVDWTRLPRNWDQFWTVVNMKDNLLFRNMGCISWLDE
jgi:hypothetical protein